MKYKNIIKAAVIALASATLFAGCVQEAFEEITEISLNRCLEPQKLACQVDPATGDYVTFKWDVNKDADSYNLVVYKDEALTDKALDVKLAPADVPYKVRLAADTKYWFKVQALSEKREASKWAIYDGHCTTYAVKDNLFLEITARTATSVSLKWSNEVADYKEVTHISATPVTGGESVKLDLTEADAEAAAATVTGLTASTEYQFVLFYMSASRGAVDAWTVADPGTMTVVSDAAALKAALVAGGNIYLKPGTYDLVSVADPAGATIKPAGSITLVGEVGADGSKPVVKPGKFELTTNLVEDNASFYFEGVTFDGGGANSRIVEHTGADLNVASVKFVNCEITNFQAGLFYDNNNGVIKLGELVFDTCDIYGILGSGGDCVDVRKTCEIGTITMVNNTIYDGIRTMFRIDAVETVKLDAVDFRNNTVKNVATIDDGNNRGFFAIRVPYAMTLKNNLFLYEDSGKTAEGETDRAQLFQINTATVEPTWTAAADNYAFACGKDFFTQISAQTCGFAVLPSDPCYNSKGNFFQLANQDLIDKKVGASKWWIPFVEKEEDLTQNVLAGAHTWNLQDASLFAGEVKNSRVRDELMLVGTEATPMNADGGINFLGASVLSKKGIPAEGYVSFKVNTPGSVDLLVAKGGASSVVVALYDESGYSVQGGVMTPSKGDVQKVIIPSVTGEGTVYLYATGAISLTKLAWSLDAEGGSRLLATPQAAVEPVTVTEGDATDITVTWDEVPHAATYKVLFRNLQSVQTERSFTIPAENVAALKAGLYSVSVQAFPADGDIYYLDSEEGKASLAIQPKGGGGTVVNVDYVWDFSAADWQTELAKVGTINTDITSGSVTYDNLNITWATKCKFNTTFFQFGGVGLNGTTGNLDRYFKFTAPAAGKLTVVASNTGSSEDLNRKVYVKVGDIVQEKAGGVASTAPTTLEFDVDAGDVFISTSGNGLRFYKIEFHCTYTETAPEPVEFEWDFAAADWQTELAKVGTINTDITSGSVAYDNLNITWATKCKFNTTFFQFAGAGLNSSTGNLDRYFKFTAPTAGKLTVVASNTGSSEDLNRKVYVKVGDTVQEKAGGVASTAPITLEFDVDAGDVFISTTGNGLRFYKISYSNK
ncbi:MAG: DUF4957 domain-containing protein [Bacteroidales bacterium]|nr:DUF4957 domain-containing protein [Bacteroidales bacterium]